MIKKILTNKIYISIVVIALLCLVPLTDNPYFLSVFILLGINILMVSSLRTITQVGHFSMAHVGFSLIGAYGSGLLVMKLGMSFWLAMVVAALMAGLLAFILGFPFLKVKGIYFVVLTVLTSETLRLLAYYWRSLTGGNQGLSPVPSPNPITLPFIGTIRFDNDTNYYFLTLVIVGISLFILYRLENSHVGFSWKAIRDAEDLSKSVGVNVMWYKVMNFAIASFFAGIAGALSAHGTHSVSPAATTRFGVSIMFTLSLYMAVGGMENFWGPTLGAVILTILTQLVGPIGEFKSLIIGGAAIIVIIILPSGIISLPKQTRLWYQKIKKRIKKVQALT